MHSSITILIAVFVIAANASSEDSGIPEIPLGLLRDSGLFKELESGNKYVNLSKAVVPEKNRSQHTTLSKHKKLNGTDTADIERTVDQHELNYAQAGCDPYDQVVEIPNDKPNIKTIPSCIQLKRCGGCCPHSDLQCIPTSTEIRNVEIIKYIYNGETVKWDRVLDNVKMEEHTGCECQCKINETQCNPAIHEYDSYDCQCKCKGEKMDCPSHKRWDDKICGCMCTQMVHCGSGYTYNMETCRCESVEERGVQNIVIEQAPTTAGPVSTKKQTTAKTAVCPNLVCPRRYKGVKDDMGICICKFDRRTTKRTRG